MNCACHKMIEAVVRHSCMEVRLHLLSALKAHSELTFVAGITRIILTKDMTSGMREQIFCSFRENLRHYALYHPCLHLPETVIGLCQYRCWIHRVSESNSG